jgi:hypothetical protein
MKNITKNIASFLLIVLLFGACIDPVTFDPNLLIGKWSRPSPFATTENPGDEYFRYDSLGTGATWDTADDVTEEEAQTFTWEVTGSQLTQVHTIEMGGTVTKIYTLTELTSVRLTYKDEFGSSFTYSKVQ